MTGETEAGVDDTGPLTLDQAVERLAGTLEAPEKDKVESEEADDAVNPETEDEGEPEEAEDGQSEDEPEDEDEEADAEDEDDQAEGQSDFVGDDAKVRLDDGTELSVADLKSGSLRMADYTRKTQEVSEERKQVREQQSRLNEFSQAILERLKTAEALAELAKPAPPDPSMEEYDPIGYLTATNRYQAAVQDFQNRYQSIQDGIKETQSVREQHQQSATQEELEQARTKLRELIPELNDPEKAKAVVSDIANAAQKAGFKPDEINTWRDERMAQLAYYAAKGMKQEAAKPKAISKTKGKPAVQKPKSDRSKGNEKRRAFDKANRRLQQTHKLEDAVEAFMINRGLSD